MAYVGVSNLTCIRTNSVPIEFNEYNSALFNIRARALNNLVYWIAQIFGSLAIGRLLDQKRLTWRSRAWAGWVVLLIMVFVVHIWAYFYQRSATWYSVTDETVNCHLMQGLQPCPGCGYP